MKYNPQIHHRSSIRLKGYDYSQAGFYFLTFCIKDRECLFGKIDVGANPGVSPQMILNDAGIMINKWWEKIPEKFPDIELDVWQIMPNHFHAIVINTGIGVINTGIDVGANPRVRPITDDPNNDDESVDDSVGANQRVRPITDNPNNDDDSVGANQRVRPITDDEINYPQKGQTYGEGQTHPQKGQTRGSAPTDDDQNTEPILGEHVGSPLHRIVQWFKTMSTNEYIRGVKTLGWPPFNGKLWQRNYYEHIIRDEQSYQNISNYIINNPSKWKDDKFYKE